MAAGGLVAVAVAGLGYVKWQPYVLRGFTAAAHHGIGPSLLTGPDAVPPPVGLAAGLGFAIAYRRSVWKALMLVLLLGAGIQVLLSRNAVRRAFAGRGARACAAGTALPAMMCTCCAAPIAVGLIRSEADTAAVLAFWLANPVVNPATLVFVGLVLGWGWAALRLALGVPLMFGFSYLAVRMLPAESRLPPPPVDPVIGAARAARAAGPVGAFGTALMRLSVQLVPEYVLQVFIQGAAREWLFSAITSAIGRAACCRRYRQRSIRFSRIPTAGEVPVVQLLQRLGFGSAGAAALLLTLPAVSLPSLVMLSRVPPARVLVMLGAGVFGFGLLAAALAPALGL